jgi:chaperonin cofactor prefoldin
VTAKAGEVDQLEMKLDAANNLIAELTLQQQDSKQRIDGMKAELNSK